MQIAEVYKIFVCHLQKRSNRMISKNLYAIKIKILNEDQKSSDCKNMKMLRKNK